MAGFEVAQLTTQSWKESGMYIRVQVPIENKELCNKIKAFLKEELGDDLVFHYKEKTQVIREAKE